ncbi:superoxide dismutase [Streptomyces canus]|uniref:SMP-30/gluconolactonase/LRE family protein n=1 Tax=Streptomyces canus TaxID=58343 RepID=UPI002E2A76F2|nr:superoxide dismutase [Streptomyces canus]
MKLSSALSAGLVAAVLTAAPIAYAAEPSAPVTQTAHAMHTTAPAQWPSTLNMPKGMRPEGIVIKGSTAYVTSFVDGTIYRFDLRTGERRVFVPATGVGSVGILLDHHGRLFVADGYGGSVRVIDSHSGKLLARYQLAAKGSYTAINDFTVLDGAVYVTDSFAPNLYKIPLGKHGQLPRQSQVRTIPLEGMPYGGEGNYGWNSNGITPTPDGKALLVVDTNSNTLFRVNPATGHATPVDLGDVDMAWGDGMRLEGRTLYVVRNTPNKLTVLRLNKSGTAGRLTAEVSDPRFDTPTTLARHGDKLYLTNAHFFSTDPANTEYAITVIPDPVRH